MHASFFHKSVGIFELRQTGPISSVSNINVFGYSPSAIVVRSESTVSADVIGSLPCLQLILRAGNGLDNIDLAYAAQRNVLVRNIPDASSRDVAELAFCLYIALARRIVNAHHFLQDGKARKDDFLGCRIEGQTMGIIGYGRIGSQLGKIAQALGMRVVASVRTCTPERVQHAREAAIELLPLESLLSVSDVVVCCLPLNTKTNKILGEEKLTLMKQNCYFVNVSRDGIVDNDVLLSMLRTHRISGIASDVWLNAGPLNPRLNIIRTPHIGAMTEKAQQEIADRSLSILLDILAAPERIG
jgi:D-3-phosphoglycerate dehydrogenase